MDCGPTGLGRAWVAAGVTAIGHVRAIGDLSLHELYGGYPRHEMDERTKIVASPFSRAT
jgi:hypothetical protein